MDRRGGKRFSCNFILRALWLAFGFLVFIRFLFSLFLSTLFLSFFFFFALALSRSTVYFEIRAYGTIVSAHKCACFSILTFGYVNSRTVCLANAVSVVCVSLYVCVFAFYDDKKRNISHNKSNTVNLVEKSCGNGSIQL